MMNVNMPGKNNVQYESRVLMYVLITTVITMAIIGSYQLDGK